MRKIAFTLVELLIVVAILAVVLPLGAYSMRRSIQKAEEKVVINSFLRAAKTAKILAMENGVPVKLCNYVGSDCSLNINTQAMNWVYIASTTDSVIRTKVANVPTNMPKALKGGTININNSYIEFNSTGIPTSTLANVFRACFTDSNSKQAGVFIDRTGQIEQKDNCDDITNTCNPACPGSQICVDGTCTPRCGTSYCQLGQRCQGGTCIPDSCSRDSDCLGEQACVSGSCKWRCGYPASSPSTGVCPDTNYQCGVEGTSGKFMCQLKCSAGGSYCASSREECVKSHRMCKTKCESDWLRDSSGECKIQCRYGAEAKNGKCVCPNGDSLSCWDGNEGVKCGCCGGSGRKYSYTGYTDDTCTCDKCCIWNGEAKAPRICWYSLCSCQTACSCYAAGGGVGSRIDLGW